MPASTPLLASKLFAPPPRPNVVPRRRLADRLDTTVDAPHRLTLVSAPAGYGKTTLLGDWLGHVDQHLPDTRVGWLSLDEADNDLTRLVTYMVAALERAGLDIGMPVPAGPAGDPTETMTALVDAVARAADSSRACRWVLVLDDYHVVTSPEVNQAVAFMLDHLPDRVHLLVATRADPVLPLARLRSRGQLTEVRAADLRFTAPEARQFLDRVMGLGLTDAEAGALEVRTEGWIAGLQLAALSLRSITQRADVTAFIEAFSGSNRFVVDYLADEVLVRQPAPVREFLLRTAVLDRLTGPLCDAVTERSDSTQVLDELERGDLFLVPLDDRRTWYRYHPLFADVLHARLLDEQPYQVPALHRRASDWFASHDSAADAVRHALAAADVARAAYLMEAAVPELRRTRQDGLLLGWVRSLPEREVRRSPVLSIVSGWSSLMSGDIDAVASRLDDAEAALTAGDADATVRAAWADTDDLRTAPATICVYRASLAQARGDVAGTVRHAQAALDQAGPQDHLVRGAGAGFLGLAAWAAGDVRQALSTFSEAVRSLHAAGNLVDALDSTVVLADMWVASGRLGRARRVYEQALQTTTRDGEPYPRATPDLHVGLAELDRELDDLASAEAHLQTARVLGARASITENRHRWSVAAALVRAAAGDHETATTLLDHAEAVYRRGFYPDVRPIAAMRARVRIAAGDLPAAADWADARAVTVDDAPGYLREYEHLTLVRLLLAEHRTAPQADEACGTPRLDAVLRLLDRLHAAAASAGRDGSVVEIRVLQALAHHARGDLAHALAALTRGVVDTPEPECRVRLFLDEGEPMRSLLRHASAGACRDNEGSGGTEGRLLRDLARRLLERTAPGRPSASGHPAVDALSRRELQVLRLLDSELTGPEIASRLYVTVNTLRSHTKRIFTKLDVTTRAAAVRRAREHGLL